MNYPLELSFKILALGSQIYIRDNNEQLIGYVKQKLFKLKEDIDIYADESQTKLLFNIKADRVIDFSARYDFTSAEGNFLGSIKRQGMRSIWKVNYEISDAENRHVFQINEESAWIKVFDSLAGEVPILGMFTGYLFNPSYIISKSDGTQIAKIAKQPAFFEGKFIFTPDFLIESKDETLILLSVLMMTLLERMRG